MAPSSNPAAVSAHSAGLVNGSAKQQSTVVSKPAALRKRIEPAIPLPYIRRAKQPIVAPQLPSPLRTNSENSEPTTNNNTNNHKVETENIQPGRDAVLSNGNSTPSYEKSASPRKPENGGAGVTKGDAELLPQQREAESVEATVPQELDAETQSRPDNRFSLPGKTRPKTKTARLEERKLTTHLR